MSNFSNSVKSSWYFDEIIIRHHYSSEELFTSMVVFSCKSKLASYWMNVLSNLAPIPLSLSHIKRVRKHPDIKDFVQIIICRERDFCNIPKELQQLFEKFSRENTESEHALPISSVSVASFTPTSVLEFTEWNPPWPISFHASELERARRKGFSEPEAQSILLNWLSLISECNTLKEKYCQPYENGAIIIDPLTNTIVSKYSDAFDNHCKRQDMTAIACNPLNTPVMLCIDHVAQIASGSLPGKETILPVGHYLCTNLDLYIYTEPDIMSCMALVHSRIRRVYFHRPLDEFGGLVSGLHHIHSLKNLNHHYRAFKMTEVMVENIA